MHISVSFISPTSPSEDDIKVKPIEEHPSTNYRVKMKPPYMLLSNNISSILSVTYYCGGNNSESELSIGHVVASISVTVNIFFLSSSPI